MRKNYVLLLVLLLSILTSCSNTANVDIDSEDNNLSYEEILDRLNTMTEERDALQKELDVLKAEMEEKSEEETIQESDVTVLVTDKSVTPEDIDNWIFSDYVNFTFSVTNNTEKDIQGIQGVLTVNDLFGEEIKSFGCDFTGQTIKPNETIINDSLSYECNSFVSEDNKLFNTDYKDLKFVYEVTQIVFTDGTVKK